MSAEGCVILCPGQGAQSAGMGRAWFAASPAAQRTFAEADEALGDSLGAPLSELCFNGPADRLNRTDVSQPAIYVCSIACHRALQEQAGLSVLKAAAGLSLGEYTALHLAGVFGFLDGLRLVATRGRLMQQAAEASRGGMVALIGADQNQAAQLCDRSANGQVLVCANFNAPGQIVISGHQEACQRALAAAVEQGLKASALAVAGAFHSPLMAPAVDPMARALAGVGLNPPAVPVWSNVTAQPHAHDDLELLKQRLVEQMVSPVLWSQTCEKLSVLTDAEYHELAPGSVLRGLMRRIDRNRKVISHDEA